MIHWILFYVPLKNIFPYHEYGKETVIPCLDDEAGNDKDNSILTV